MDVRFEIMTILLNTGEDVPVREIARRLNLPVGHVHYHLKKMVVAGVLVREEFTEGKKTHAYYTPQPIFTGSVGGTLKVLEKLSKKIRNPTDEKIAECLTLFLKCYDAV